MSLSIPKSTLIALLVAGAFFMENLDGTVIRNGAAANGEIVPCEPRGSKYGDDGVPADAGGVHPDQRLVCGPLWGAHCFSDGDRRCSRHRRFCAG